MFSKNGSKSSRALNVVIAVLFLIACVLVYFILNLPENSGNQQQTRLPESLVAGKPLAIHSLPALKEGQPAITFLTASPASSPTNPIRGVLLLMHGCYHNAYDFWNRSACTDCTGLPVGSRISASAMQAGFHVAAISPKSTCWDYEDDLPRVMEVITFLKEKEGFDTLPFYCLGISSSVPVCASLPAHVKNVKGVAFQIMNVNVAPLLVPSKYTYPYPPSVWIHMPRDRFMAEKIGKSLEQMRAARRPVLEIEVGALSVHKDYFSKHFPAISSALSAKIVAELQGAGLLDPHGTLVHDPNGFDWRAPLMRNVMSELQAIDTLKPNQSPVSELLNLAFANHEATPNHMEETFEFWQNFAGV